MYKVDGYIEPISNQLFLIFYKKLRSRKVLILEDSAFMEPIFNQLFLSFLK